MPASTWAIGSSRLAPRAMYAVSGWTIIGVNSRCARSLLQGRRADALGRGMRSLRIGRRGVGAVGRLAPLAPAGLLGRFREEHFGALVGVGVEKVAPPVRQLLLDLAGFGTEQQEVEGRLEARLFQQA